MSKPKFLIYVQPRFRVNGCATKRAEESRGMMGFHSFERCPACDVVFEGFDLWGENGHLQGTVNAGDNLDAILEHRRACRNETFKMGSPIHYQGICNGKIGPAHGIQKD